VDSPRNTALRRSLSSPISCVAYLSFLVGLSDLCTTNPALRIGGTAPALGAIGVFIYLRHSITKMFVDFCASARATDMADMARSYDVPVLLPLLADGRQMRSPDEKTKGQPGFGSLPSSRRRGSTIYINPRWWATWDSVSPYIFPF
jgi:hypothetical protein